MSKKKIKSKSPKTSRFAEACERFRGEFLKRAPNPDLVPVDAFPFLFYAGGKVFYEFMMSTQDSEMIRNAIDELTAVPPTFTFLAPFWEQIRQISPEPIEKMMLNFFHAIFTAGAFEFYRLIVESNLSEKEHDQIVEEVKHINLFTMLPSQSLRPN